MSKKRVNFNMAAECHSLLKSVCALKGVSVQDYCYDLIANAFEHDVYHDKQIQKMFLSADYPVGSRAYHLKLRVLSELENE